jgi:dTDP-4-dehydrorhamnose reductase
VAAAADRVTDLVLGASGLLGSHLMELRSHALGTYRTHPRPGLARLDMGDADAARGLLRDRGLRHVVVAANPPSLEWCEAHAQDSHREQVEALQKFLTVLDEIAPASTLIFLSTDYVFDGRRGRYVEEDRPAPLQAYGRDKLAAEDVVRRSGHPAWIVRTSLLYGENRWEPGAAASFPLQVVRAARTAGRLVASDGLVSNPTEVRSLARLIWWLADRPPGGLLHAVGGPALTRLEFAHAALRVWGLPPWPGLERVSPSREGRLPGQSLRRPRDSSLATVRLERLTGRLPTVEEGLSAVRRRVGAAP